MLMGYQEDQGIDVHRKKSVEAGLESERIRMYKTEAYQKFTSGKIDEISKQDFYKFARVNEYFRKNLK